MSLALTNENSVMNFSNNNSQVSNNRSLSNFKANNTNELVMTKFHNFAKHFTEKWFNDKGAQEYFKNFFAQYLKALKYKGVEEEIFLDMEAINEEELESQSNSDAVQAPKERQDGGRRTRKLHKVSRRRSMRSSRV